MNARRVGIVAYNGCHSLDISGPLEVFQAANHTLRRNESRDPGYVTQVISPDGGPVRSISGLQLGADLALNDAGPLDTLLIPGGDGVREVATDAALVRAIDRLARETRRVTSVCTGAFVLAAAGWLEDRRATTHWAYCETLAELSPRTTVVHQVVYVHDGVVWTSAGVAAGMDLALALVEDDLGPEVANQVARWLVLYVRRAAGQPQTSEQLRLDVAERPGVRDLPTWILDHPTADLSVPALARRCGMSVRNFARLFRSQTGSTPARYVERVRVETARRLLETSEHSADEVAARSGFESADALRRSLRRSVGVGPRAYRETTRDR